MSSRPPAGRPPSDTHDSLAAVERSELARTAIGSVRWVAGSRVAVEAIAISSTVALARLIPPSEFGHAAIALIAVSLATVVTAQGLGYPLVRFPDISHQQVETAAFLSILTGIVLSIVTYVALVPYVIDPVFGARTADLFRIVSPVWFLAALGTVPLALLQRRMNFRRIVMFDIFSLAVGSITSVVCAIAGLDGEALVIGALVATGTASFLYLITVPFVLPRFRPHESASIARFGVPITLSSIAYTAFRNVDYAVLGARLGAAPLGLYYRAYQVAVEYQGKITGIMQRVGFPLYARTDSLEDMRRVRERVSRLHATVVVPLLALLVPLAPIVIPLVFGHRWGGAVKPTQILAGAGVTEALVAGTGPVMTAAGKAIHLVWLNLGMALTYGTVVYLVAPHGLVAVCWAVVGFQVVAMAAIFLLVQQTIGISVQRLVADAIPAFVSCGPLLAAAFAVREALEPTSLGDFPLAIAVAAAGAGAYLLTLRLLFGAAWADVSLITRRLLRRDTSRRGWPSAASPSS